jgi:hypothetical protein
MNAAVIALPFWQLITVVGVPTLMVLVGILMNRQDFHRLNSQFHNDMMIMQSTLRDMEGRLSKVEARQS